MNYSTSLKLRRQQIVETLTTAICEATTVEVTTYVNSSDLDEVGTDSSSRIHTEIDLLNQSIDHEIDLKLIDNSTYEELQRWHIEQVKQRQDSILANLAGSIELCRRFREK